jgi:hypothetical protein
LPSQSLYNKGQRRAKVKTLLMAYAQNIQYDDPIIDANIEYARDFVWRQMVLANESDFRTYITIADGSSLPIDYTAYSNDAVYTYSGSQYSFSYIATEEIASRKTNPYSIASNTSPSIYFEDQKVKTLPAGLAGVTFGYYPRQAKMFGSSIPDSTYDTMPYQSEDLIHQLACEYTLEQLLPEEKAYLLTQQQAAEVLSQNQKFYEGLFENQMLNPRTQSSGSL